MDATEDISTGSSAQKQQGAGDKLEQASSLKGFWLLFSVQLLNAFSDNFFKFLVIFFASKDVEPAVRDLRLFQIAAVFALPFILFSMASGALADRFSKGRVITWTKILELFIMAAGACALAAQSFPMMLTVIFLMSVQSTMFSPAKYASLPELLPSTRLSWGNGLIGLGSFCAIITGGVVAGVASVKLGNEHVWKAAIVLVAIAAGGLLISLKIPRISPANPEKRIRVNFISELLRNLKVARSNRVLILAITGCVYFWLLGALLEPTLVVYGQDLLKLNDKDNSFLRAFMAIGIAIGSVLAGFLSGRKIEYGLIPLGSLGLAACSLLLGLPGLSFAQVSILLALLGVAGGFLSCR